MNATSTIHKFFDLDAGATYMHFPWKPEAPFDHSMVHYWAVDDFVLILYPDNKSHETLIAAHAIALESVHKTTTCSIFPGPILCCTCYVANFIGCQFNLNGPIFICHRCYTEINLTKPITITINSNTPGSQNDDAATPGSQNDDTKKYHVRKVCVYGLGDSHIVVQENNTLKGYAKLVYKGISPNELVKLKNLPTIAVTLCVLCSQQQVQDNMLICQHCEQLNVDIWVNKYWIVIPALGQYILPEITKMIISLI